jgi:hypothetical protein
MGQMEMKCILNIEKKYFYIGQGYSGERCGPWASCLKERLLYVISSVKVSIIQLSASERSLQLGNYESVIDENESSKSMLSKDSCGEDLVNLLFSDIAYFLT